MQGGLIFWSIGIYTSTFEDVFQTSRAKITFLETLLSVTINTLSPVTGYFVDKGSTRNLVALGFASIGLGFILIGRAQSLLHLYLVFVFLIPFGVLAVGVNPSSALITRWFRKRRGLALGISISGSSIGGAVGPVLVTFLFMSFGWRTGMTSLGICLLLVAPLVWRFLVNQPEDIGLVAEQDHESDNQQTSPADEIDWTIPEMLRTKALWLQTLISGSLLAVTLGLLANMGLHAKDLGFTGQSVAALYSILAFFSFSGKIAFGSLTDRIGLKNTGYLSICLMITGLSLMIPNESYTGLVCSCAFIGLAVGGVTPIWTTMIGQAFGGKSFGRAMGIMNPMHIPITAPSPWLAGKVSDTTGSYDLMFLIYIGLMCIAAFALYALQKPQHPTSSQDLTSESIQKEL